MTDRLTDHATPPVPIGRIYAVMQCGLKMQYIMVQTTTVKR